MLENTTFVSTQQTLLQHKRMTHNSVRLGEAFMRSTIWPKTYTSRQPHKGAASDNRPAADFLVPSLAQSLAAATLILPQVIQFSISFFLLLFLEMISSTNGTSHVTTAKCDVSRFWKKPQLSLLGVRFFTCIAELDGHTENYH